MTYARYSPVRHRFPGESIEWKQVLGMDVPSHLGRPITEKEHAKTLALVDLSVLLKLGIKGAGAAAFLQRHEIVPPEAIQGWGTLKKNSGSIIRLKKDEFFLEDGLQGELLPGIRAALAAGLPDCRLVERQDAGFVLSGVRSGEVLRETCAVDPGKAGDRVIMSRIAGVSCMILPLRGSSALRIWCEASYGVYLWDTLAEIVYELGGMIAGLDSVAHLL